MFRTILLGILVIFSINVMASRTINTSQTQINEVYPWKIATKDDGYFQILGEYDHKKFIVYVSPVHNGKKSDPIIINCNAGNDIFEAHEVAPGSTIECYPHFNDVISMYIEPALFKNGSEGTFKYEPYHIK